MTTNVMLLARNCKQIVTGIPGFATGCLHTETSRMLIYKVVVKQDQKNCEVWLATMTQDYERFKWPPMKSWHLQNAMNPHREWQGDLTSKEILDMSRASNASSPESLSGVETKISEPDAATWGPQMIADKSSCLLPVDAHVTILAPTTDIRQIKRGGNSSSQVLSQGVSPRTRGIWLGGVGPDPIGIKYHAWMFGLQSHTMHVSSNFSTEI
eukprot:Gb_00738 [translate_table: standard]